MVKTNKLVWAILLFLVLFTGTLGLTLSLESPAYAKTKVSDKIEQVVYITRTGHKYHRAWCRYLRQSKIEISKSEAVEDGYTPCKICRP